MMEQALMLLVKQEIQLDYIFVKIKNFNYRKIQINEM